MIFCICLSILIQTETNICLNKWCHYLVRASHDSGLFDTIFLFHGRIQCQMLNRYPKKSSNSMSKITITYKIQAEICPLFGLSSCITCSHCYIFQFIYRAASQWINVDYIFTKIWWAPLMYSGLGISCIKTLKETHVQYYSVGVLCTLDTLMLASKSFPLSSLSG